MTPFELAADVVARLDRLGVEYVIGGSLALMFAGEPRSTADVDIAVELSIVDLPRFTEAVAKDFYISDTAAASAVERSSSFNLIDQRSAYKVDLFVLGAGLLDRMQLERRRLIELPVEPRITAWVTSPEDIVLRKLDWYRRGGRVSDRQWRDIIGVLRVQDDALDLGYLRETADAVGLRDDLEEAITDAAT